MIPGVSGPCKIKRLLEVCEYSIRGCFFVENVPDDLIRIPLLLQSDCRHVAAYLMLKLVQPFEGIDLLDSF